VNGTEFVRSLTEFYLRAKVLTIPQDEVWFVGVNNTLACVSLSIQGYLRNEGVVTIRDELDVDGGELDNVGEVIVGWS